MLEYQSFRSTSPAAFHRIPRFTRRLRFYFDDDIALNEHSQLPHILSLPLLPFRWTYNIQTIYEPYHAKTCLRSMRRLSPDHAQSDQGLRCPLTESLDTIECINREQRPGWDSAMRRMS